MPDRLTTSRGVSLPRRALLALLSLALVLGALPLTAPLSARAADETPAVGSEVIVVLDDGADPVAAARDIGVEIRHIYRHVFTGFSGIVTATPPPAAATARSRRVVKTISPDGPVRVEAQVIPTGVSRAGTPKDPDGQHLAIPSPVDADIAVVDTGIADDNSDLNVVDGFSCIGNDPDAWQDDFGHGTHVAGIAAAKDNDVGVVGVAPGARLWAVKVLDSDGEGSFGDVICGLDWVAAHADTIDVINLSLSGKDKKGNCNGPALHEAICAVVDAGVTVVVAAGNQGTNAKERVPANYNEVITVSGIADSDGEPGRLGPKPCFADKDDMFLNFSNFGEAVDIAAPGGCILSYTEHGSLITESGTSEAAPHVTGAAANFIADQGSGASPDAVRTWLLTDASRPQSVDGVTGDPDSKAEKQKVQQKKIKKAKKKVKGAKGKKGKKRAKQKLKKLKRQNLTDGHLEPVLWLEVLG